MTPSSDRFDTERRRAMAPVWVAVAGVLLIVSCAVIFFGVTITNRATHSSARSQQVAESVQKSNADNEELNRKIVCISAAQAKYSLLAGRDLGAATGSPAFQEKLRTDLVVFVGDLHKCDPNLVLPAVP